MHKLFGGDGLKVSISSATQVVAAKRRTIHRFETAHCLVRAVSFPHPHSICLVGMQFAQEKHFRFGSRPDRRMKEYLGVIEVALLIILILFTIMKAASKIRR